MTTQEKISQSYKLGAGKYDRVLSTQAFFSRLLCRLVWGFADTEYALKLLVYIPDSFGGRLLDVPAGTALFTVDKYIGMPDANITCLDYSEAMLNKAKEKFEQRGLANITCLQGDVGALPFTDAAFDCVLSMNGFHAFPNKDAAFAEIFRVLKPGGSFIGCFYIKDQVKRTDWFVRHFYQPQGFFTPPFMTWRNLEQTLSAHYHPIEMWNCGAMVCFKCIK